MDRKKCAFPIDVNKTLRASEKKILIKKREIFKNHLSIVKENAIREKERGKLLLCHCCECELVASAGNFSIYVCESGVKRKVGWNAFHLTITLPSSSLMKLLWRIFFFLFYERDSDNVKINFFLLSSLEKEKIHADSKQASRLMASVWLW